MHKKFDAKKSLLTERPKYKIKPNLNNHVNRTSFYSVLSHEKNFKQKMLDELSLNLV